MLCGTVSVCLSVLYALTLASAFFFLAPSHRARSRNSAYRSPMQSPFRASHKRSTEMDSSVPEPRPSTEQGRGQRQQGAEGRGSRGRGRGRGGRRYVARRPRAEAAQPADAQQPQQPQAAAEQRQPQPRGDDVQKQQRQQQQRRRRQRGPKAKQTAGGAAAQAQQEEEDIGDFCFICANPIEYYAIGDCNHLTCSMCALRLRYIGVLSLRALCVVTFRSDLLCALRCD